MGGFTSTKKLTYEAVKNFFTEHGYFLKDEEYVNSTVKMNTVCPKNHVYLVSADLFKNRGYRCPECSGNKAYTLETAKKVFCDNGYEPLFSEYHKNTLPLKVKCSKGHVSYPTLNNFLRGARCIDCSGSKKHTIEKIREHLKQDGYELDQNNYAILDWVKTFYPSAKTKRFKYKGKLIELDIYVPELNLAIEYNGLYWHSSEFKPSNYHTFKMEAANSIGVRLVSIFEDEWLNKNEQVKGFLISVMGKCLRKIFARNTVLKIVESEEAKKFLEENHIQGATKFKIAYGLYANEELVALVSGGTHHRQNNEGSFVLSRLVFKSGVSVAGGSSKLLKSLVKYAKDHNYRKLISWSDNRWSEGNVYLKTGFKLDSELGSDYSYVKGLKRIPKQSYTKKNLAKLGAKGATESEMAASLKLFKIYDCGKKRWSIDLSGT